MSDWLRDVALTLGVSFFLEKCPYLAAMIIRLATYQMPTNLRTRYEDDWMSTLAYVDQPLSKIGKALWILFNVPSIRKSLKLAPIDFVVLNNSNNLVKVYVVALAQICALAAVVITPLVPISNAVVILGMSYVLLGLTLSGVAFYQRSIEKSFLQQSFVVACALAGVLGVIFFFNIFKLPESYKDITTHASLFFTFLVALDEHKEAKRLKQL